MKSSSIQFTQPFLVALAVATLSLPGQALAGTEKTFAVLAGTTVTNTGPTTVTGDLGVAPGTAITGFPPGTVASGTIHANDATAVQAKADLAQAYNAANATACTADLSGQDLGGMTLAPGVYCFAGAATQASALTLDFQGNPNAVFLFKTAGALTTTGGSSVVLINNGSASCPPNVTWKVGSSATIGTGSQFVGSILAFTSITLVAGANLSGSALAINGAVTMDTNAVTRCVAAPPPPPPPPPTPVPTLSEWSMILFGLFLAGGAALLIQRRPFSA